MNCKRHYLNYIDKESSFTRKYERIILRFILNLLPSVELENTNS